MLLHDVKNHLRITWDDEDSDIQKLIERAKSVLNGKVGVELDYLKEGLPKALLLDYCRYSRNNSLEYYDQNFHSDLLHLKLMVAVKEKGEEHG